MAGRSLGIGLNGIADWSTEIPFIDAFKSARTWIPQNASTWDTHEPLNLDDKGWIRSLPDATSSQAHRHAGTLLLLAPNQYRSGRYVAMYEGTGKVNYSFDAKKIDAESVPGRDVLQVNSAAGGGIYLGIQSTDPNKTGDYIRNIRVYHEDDLPLVELGMHFNPDFLQKIKDFGTLRFMDWMRTNNSTQQDWANRPKLDDSSWAKKGAPVELMVELANETGCSPWFTMPHQASDDYIRNFATYVRDNLNPNLKAYVEFSNEVWNWQFSQSHYAKQQAETRWGKGVEGGFMQWYGMRSAQVAEIWKSVFANQTDRVTTVLSTQTGWQGVEKYALDTPAWVAEGHAPAWKSVDAYAVTGYFSGKLGAPGNAETVRSWLSEPDGGFGKAIQQLQQGGLLPSNGDSVLDTINSFRYQAGVARQYGLQLVAYEGGQHIVGTQGVENDQQLTNFFIELNRRPEMRGLYQQLLEGWRQSGGTLFNHFVAVASPTKWGSWGSLENLNQTTSPKYGALTDFLSTYGRWWSEPSSGDKVGQYLKGVVTGDTLGGGNDNDIVLGRAGNDVINGNAGADRLHGEADNDRINGGIGADAIGGGTGNDTLMGGGDNDVLLGGAGKNVLSGSTGDDILLGMGNNTVLAGTMNYDILPGQMGQDTLTGGAGADRFVYAGASQAEAFSGSLVSATDRVVDFRTSQGDHLQLDYDNNLGTVDLPRGVFNAGVITSRTLADAATKAVADKNQQTSGAQSLTANESTFFQWSNKSYLIVKGSHSGSAPAQDLVVNVTGIEMMPGDATKGVLAVHNYFM